MNFPRTSKFEHLKGDENRAPAHSESILVALPTEHRELWGMGDPLFRSVGLKTQNDFFQKPFFWLVSEIKRLVAL